MNVAGLLNAVEASSREMRLLEDGLKAGQLSAEVHDLSPALRSFGKIAGEVEAGAKIGEINHAAVGILNARQAALTDFFLHASDDPNMFRSFATEMAAKIQAGEDFHPAQIASKHMIGKESPLGLDHQNMLDWWDESQALNPYEGKSVNDVVGEGVANHPVIQEMQQDAQIIPEEPAPDEVAVLAGSMKAAADADADPLLHSGSSPALPHDKTNLLMEARALAAPVGSNPEVPADLFNLSRIAEDAAPSHTFDEARAGHNVAVTPEVLDGFLRDDPASVEQIDRLLDGSRRPPDARNVKVDGEPPLGTDSPPPGAGGGRPIDAPNNILRAPMYFMKGQLRSIYTDLTRGFMGAEDWNASLREMAKPTWSKLGSSERSRGSAHLAMMLDVTPYNQAKAAKDVATYTKSLEDIYAGVGRAGRNDAELVVEAGKVEQNLEAAQRRVDWLDHYKTIMDDYHAELTPEKQAQFEAAAAMGRKIRDINLLMLKRAGHIGTMGEGGIPLGQHYHHYFPEVNSAVREALSRKLAGGNAPDKIRMAALMRREGSVGYAYDAVTEFNQYNGAVSRKLFVEPILKDVSPSNLLNSVPEEYIPALEDMFQAKRSTIKGLVDENPRTANLSNTQRGYLTEYLKAKMGIPTGLDKWCSNALSDLAVYARQQAATTKNPVTRKALEFAANWNANMATNPRPATAATMFFVDRLMRGTIGLNPATIFKNLVSQPLMTIAKTSAEAGLASIRNQRGVRSLNEQVSFSREVERFLNPNDTSISHSIGRARPSDWTAEGVQQFAKFLDKKTGDFVMYPFGQSEAMVRGFTWGAGLSHELAIRGFRTMKEAMAAGKWYEEIIPAVRELDNNTNFIYGVGGQSPYLSRYPARKATTTFTTYPYNMWETGWKWFSEPGNGNAIEGVRWLALSGYFQGLMWRLGTDVKQWVGFPGAMEFNTSKTFPIQQVSTDAGTAAMMILAGSPKEKEQAKKKLAQMALMLMLPGFITMRRFVPDPLKEQGSLRGYHPPSAIGSAYLAGEVRGGSGQRRSTWRGSFANWMEAWLGQPSQETSIENEIRDKVYGDTGDKGVALAAARQKYIDIYRERGLWDTGKVKPTPEMIARTEADEDAVLRSVEAAGGNAYSFQQEMDPLVNKDAGDPSALWKSVEKYPEMHMRLRAIRKQNKEGD